MKAGTNLEKVLESGRFAVTAEAGPPKGTSPAVIQRKGELLRPCCDAVNVTDNQTAIVRMSSLAGCVLLKQAGVEPVLQMVTRDRNRIALQSDVLGAVALGIGNILADGVRIMAKKFDVDPELAAHVKGLEMPMHDPRAFAGQALSYITCYLGANHQKCDWYSVEITTASFPTLRVKIGKNRTSIKKREKGVIALQDIRAIDDSAVNCTFYTLSLDYIIGHINAATGVKYDKKTILRLGERINNLKRLIDCKLGITREDDKLPGILKQELKSGKTVHVKLDLEENLKVYYQRRGWDWETGKPTEEKLKELNLS